MNNGGPLSFMCGGTHDALGSSLRSQELQSTFTQSQQINGNFLSICQEYSRENELLT